jgi:hypothetical protein
MVLVKPQESDGGVVRRRFSAGGRQFMAGEELTAAQVNGFPVANRNALVSAGFLHLHPKKGAGSGAPPERHVVNLGFGKFNVVQGTKLNEKPLTKEQAEKLARNIPGIKAVVPDDDGAQDA